MSQVPIPTPSEEQTPQRHGCLTALLVFIILLDALAAVTIPTFAHRHAHVGFHNSPVGIAIREFCSMSNIVFALALFRWQRWGFYGIAITTVLAVATNLIGGLPVVLSLLGLLRIGIFYRVLNLGGLKKAWPNLK